MASYRPPLAPSPLLLLCLPLLFLGALSQPARQLRLGQALLQGLLQPGQCQACLLAPKML